MSMTAVIYGVLGADQRCFSHLYDTCHIHARKNRFMLIRRNAAGNLRIIRKTVSTHFIQEGLDGIYDRTNCRGYRKAQIHHREFKAHESGDSRTRSKSGSNRSQRKNAGTQLCRSWHRKWQSQHADDETIISFPCRFVVFRAIFTSPSLQCENKTMMPK